jgi:glycine oxidase
VPDVLVAGGGIIGLAVAWRARQAGLSVRVLERGAVGSGASHVAAGMLAPVSEVELGEHGRRTIDLALRAAQAWPGFAAELRAAGGGEVGLRRAGTLMVARDGDEARELERQLAFRRSLGVRAERLRPSEAREREPALAPTIRLALEAPDDHSVDPRLALAALRRACELAGVEVEEGACVRGVALDRAGERAEGVVMADGERRPAGLTVLAAGAWSGRLDLGPVPGVPVRPVKGQVMILRDRVGAATIGRAIRCQGAYVVPRADGRIVLGATVEEQGFDMRATAGAAYELLREARELAPGLTELDLEEVCVGLRPGTPDNAPIIGAGECEALIWATGHYRNGILLAPLTAELVRGLVEGRAPDPLLEVCDPLRAALRDAPRIGAGMRMGAGEEDARGRPPGEGGWAPVEVAHGEVRPSPVTAAAGEAPG